MFLKMYKHILVLIGIVFLCTTSSTAALEIKSSIDEFLDVEETKTISMDFKDADLNTVLKIFSQQSGLNFITSIDASEKRINLYLEKVPVEEALERILSANNLTYEIKPESNIFVVNERKSTEKQLMTRVYPLKHATVASSKLSTTLIFEGISSTESPGILAAIKGILTEDGSVTENPRTNSLIVTDVPAQFPFIEQTIARLDVRIPQILIEVEMLDISQNTATLLGAKFGATPMTFSGAERDSIYPFNRNKAMRDDANIGSKGFSFEDPEYRVSTLSFSGLTFALQFLRTQSDTKNLARPRILTLNNDTAEIQIKTDEAIGIGSTTTASEGTSTSVAQAERVETGVFLRVTPQANIDTKEITMAIEPKVIQARTGGTFSGQTFKDPEERGTKSVLRVKDGDTIIIGGLLRTDFDETKTRVPVISKIPVLGSAFKHKDKSRSERELIIFITPHITDELASVNLEKKELKKFVREQNTPINKLQAVNNELSHFEQKKF